MLAATMVLASTMWTWTGPAPQPDPRPIREISREAVQVLNGADPRSSSGPLLPVAALVEVGERLHATLTREGLNTNQGSVLLGLMYDSWWLAFTRTNDPSYLCRAIETLRDRVGPFESSIHIGGKVSEWIAEAEAEHAKRTGRACPPPPPPVVEPEPEVTPEATKPPEAVTPPSALPKPEGPVRAVAPTNAGRAGKTRRNPKRIAAGASLLVASAGSAAGFTAALLLRARWNREIGEIEETIVAERRAATESELAEASALNERYGRATAVAVITGTASAAALTGGLLLLLLPEQRTRTIASPWSGAGMAGLLIHGRF